MTGFGLETFNFEGRFGLLMVHYGPSGPYQSLSFFFLLALATTHASSVALLGPFSASFRLVICSGGSREDARERWKTRLRAVSGCLVEIRNNVLLDFWGFDTFRTSRTSIAFEIALFSDDFLLLLSAFFG